MKKDEYIEYEGGRRVLLDEDGVPELTEGFFKNANATRDILPELLDKNSNKIETTFCFDEDILKEFQSHGENWQVEVNSILRQWIDKRPDA